MRIGEKGRNGKTGKRNEMARSDAKPVARAPVELRTQVSGAARAPVSLKNWGKN